MTKQFLPSAFGVNSEKKSGAAIERARSALLSGSSLTRNPKDWRKRNGLEFDSLERRYLLSADISPYTDALDDGIDRLQFLIDELADFEEMSANVPILGESLSEAAHLSETLATELLDPLRSIISGLTAGDDINDLALAIDSIAGVSTSGVIDTNNEASLDILFETDFTNSGNIFDLGTEASQLGISIDSTFDFTTTISFDFGLGILLDPALAPAEAIFVDDGSVLTLSGSADLKAAAGSDTVKVGLLGAASLDASSDFSLSAEVYATMNDTIVDDGRITLAEMDSSGLAMIGVAINGSNTGLTADLKIDSVGSITDLILSDAGITISLDGNFFESPTLSVSIDTPKLADFSRLNAASLLSFFGDLGATLETLSTAFNEFASIDIIDINIGDYASFDIALRQLASSLSIPGLIGGALPDLDALLGTSESFDIKVTQYDPSLETQLAPVIQTINLDLDAIATAVDGASDKLGELVAQINAAIGGSLGVEAFEKQGYVGIRATDELVTDVVLLEVNAAITAVMGFQNEQTAFALPTFDTIQEFAAQLESLDLFDDAVNLVYDDVSSSLTFDLNIDFDSAAFERTMSFNYALDLGGFGELALSGSADVAVDADMSFSFGAGFDLTAIGDTMQLAELNGGAGVGTSPSGQPDLLIVTLDGESHSIDLSSVTTIADLKAAIFAGTGELVTVTTDPSGSGLILTDSTLEGNLANAPGREEPTFVIAGAEFSSAIYDLGFGFGIAAPDSSNVIGGASLIDRFFIDANSMASAGVSIAIPDVDLYGAIGFVSVEIINGGTSAPIEFGLNLSLQDVDNSDGLARLYLSELGRQTSADISGDAFNEPGVFFEITLKDGTTHSVDLSDATNNGEAIALLDGIAGMRAFLNSNGTGVVLVDETSGIEDFSVAVSTPDPQHDVLGFNLNNVDEVNGDGILRGSLLASDGFAALNNVDFDSAITGELLLPISFGDLGAALGLGDETFYITIDFVQGSILPVIDTSGLTDILQALTSLGSADLLTLVGQISGALFDKIDALNADLPLLDASISDLVDLIQNGVDDLLGPVADKINDQLIFEIDKAMAYIDPSLIEDLKADALASGAFDDLTAFNDFATVSSDFLAKLAGSDAGMLLIEAMEELRAQIRGLPGGFDLLFSDAPSKLISAFAAMRGALKKLQEEFSGDAGFLTDLEDAFGDQLKVIEDIIPSTRTILRLVQEALGFELPRLDETLGDVANKLNDDLKLALVAASDTVTDVSELTDKTIAEMIGLAGELLDDMGTEVDSAIDALITQVEALIADGVDADDILNIDEIIPALEAVKAFLNDGGIPDSLADIVATLEDIAANGTNIFELIAEVPSITAMLAEIENQVATLTGSLLNDLRDYLPDDSAEDNLNAVISNGLALVDRSIDEFRATVLGYFGGGILQIGYTEGRYDVNLHIAPSLFEINTDNLDFNFSVGDNLFSAGVEDGAISFELGGVIDLGLALEYDAGSTTFGTDFELLISEDTGFRLEAELTVNGALFVNLGGVGVQFAQESSGAIDTEAASFTLTNDDKTGPAFFDIGVTGTAIDGFIALAEAGFGATGEARLFGEVFGFSKTGTPILWDHDADAGTPGIFVDMGIDAAVTLSGGEFDFSFNTNPLESGEIAAILASLVDFSFENILEAFEQLLDFVIDATEALSEAPLIGGPLDDLNDVLIDFRDAYEAFGALLDGLDEDVDDVIVEVREFIFSTFVDFLDAEQMKGNAGDVNVFEAEDILLSWDAGSGDLTDRELVLEPLHFGFSAEDISVPFDFGLDALVFEIGADGEVTVDFNLNVVMGFGLSIERGAYLVLPDLDTDGTIDPIFSGEFSAELDGEFSLSLFFLGVQAEVWDEGLNDGLTDDDKALQEASGMSVADFIAGGHNQDAVGEGVSFSTALDLNIVDGAGDVVTTSGLDQTASDDFIIPIVDLGDYGLDVDFEIDVDIDLFLRGGADLGGEFTVSNLPNITTYMNVDWTWSAGDDSIMLPGLQFYDLSLNLGEFVENALGPLLDFIDDFTAPLDPFFDFLDLEIPILSQLSQLFGQGPLTVVDAISLLGSGIESIEVILQILDTIDAVTDFIESLSSGTLINFGDFIVSDPYGVTSETPQTTVDLSQKEGRTAISGESLFAMDFGKDSAELDSEIGANDTTGGDDGGGITGIFDTLQDVGLSLPFLEDPAQLFGLLFGERIDFIIWDIPRMSAEFGVSYKFGPIIPPIPLFVTVGGGFEIFLDLLVGYDSRGLETGNFLDGFFFGDHTFDAENNEFTNEDPLELGLSVFFEATASLSVVIAEAGVTGGVSAEVGANWADDDGDGKFYLDEMYQKLQQGILCIFDFEGALEAYLEAFVKLGFDTPFGFVTLFEETFEFLRVTLLDFSVTCPPLPAPEIATVDGSGDTTARLNIGAFAAERQPGAGDGEEKVEIFGDRIEVDGAGVAIIDAETVRSLWTTTGLVDAIAAGYFDDGKLTHTEAQAGLAAGYLNPELDLNLDGDIDVDEIRTVLDLNNNNAGIGDRFALLIGFGEWEVFNNLTVIYGDAGAEDDQILGDADSLKVALHVLGGAGDDEIIGGMGNDVLLGGAGDDIVRGHAGDDKLYGDGAATADITEGLSVTNNTTGIGEDVVYGGDGADLIYGGGGNDMLKGDGENEDPADSADLGDWIYGNAGEDAISGFLGDDVLFGGSGADNIDGQQGDDIIRGDIEFAYGTDAGIIKTSQANSSSGEIDLLIGGVGSDTIRGDGGNDLIFGERDGFELLSNLPSTLGDFLYGDGGDDVIRGQFGNDTILGGDDEDLLIGGAGADAIYGNDDNDEIWGDRYPADGLAAATSDEEGDPSELGVDYIEGGDGADKIFGGQGGDWIIGGVSNTSEYTGSDADTGDTIRGGSGDDIILGDDGTITSNTAYSTDTSGTGGDDKIYAESGNDQIAGGQGSDLIFGDQSGGVGEDIIFGDEVIRGGLLLTGTYNSNDTDGADIILGYGGSDLIVAGGDSDSAFGSVGDDLIVGDYAKILLKSGAFATLYDSVAWVVSLDPDKGAGDRLLGQAGEDIVIGGDGDDYISGGGASDVSDDILLGDHGLVVRDDGSAVENDIFSIFGDFGGNDEIYGGNGKDIIIGGTGDDQIFGQAADDVILGDAGAVLRSSGATPEVQRVVSTFAELDIADIDSVNLTSVGLVDLGGDAGDPVATGEDDLDGGDGSDVMLGGLGADILFGRNDSDILLGDNGEVLYTGAGSGLPHVTTIRTIGTNGARDAIFGESGKDVAFAGADGDFVFGDLTAEVTREFIVSGSYYTFTFNNFSAVATGADDDTLAGDFGELSLVNGMPALLQSTDFADGGRDLIEGHEGSDVLIGGADSDALHGDAAQDRIGLLVFGTTDATGDDIVIGDSGLVNWLDGNSDASDVDYISSLAPGIGGSDVIFGNNGNDILIGGMAGDRIYGDRTGNVDLTDMSVSDETTGSRTGSDRILGDNGFVDFLINSDTIEGRPDYGEGAVVVDLAIGTILISTSDPIYGGDDLILGDGQSDLIFGGTGSDRIWGDDGDMYAANDAVTDGDDIIFGDHGKAWQTSGVLGREAPFVGDDYFSIDTHAADLGAGDVIFGEGGDDIILGQQGDDIIFGNSGNDSLIGGHNTEGGIDDLDVLNSVQVLAILPAELRDLDPTDLQELNDIISGGEGEDVIAGDNAIIQMEGVVTSERYQELTDGENLYSMITDTVPTSVGDFDVDLGFMPNIDGAIADPSALLPRNIFLLDVDAATELNAANNPSDPRVFGDDIISGGADSDEIFGQLGDDIIQGDGSIEFEVDIDIDEPFNAAADSDPTFVIQNGGGNVTLSPAAVLPITNGDLRALRFVVDSNTSDGDDYIEGNGGNDRIYGNLGQDDLIGGSSELGTAFAIGTGSAIRPDGADLIYGGSGDPAWLARSASYIEVADGLVSEDNFHVADADVIVGDNANIFRLDGLAFNYAQQGGTYTGYGTGSGDLQDALSVRVVQLLDYEYSIDGSSDDPDTGTVDWKMTFNDFGVGAGDLLHGESGDDIIFGMTGDDLIYGEAGDDDLYGQAGADVMFGGRGVDGILGDDGLLSTSRNGLTEELNGLAVANEQEIIRTPGNLQLALIYRTDLLNKSADMIAFDLDGVDFAIEGAVTPQMTSANDIIFGGWEDDFIHSGYGDDAVSGAEALPVYYSGEGTSVSGIDEVNDFLKAQQDTDLLAPAAAPDPFWYDLGLYNPGDILRFSAFDPEEFALYDENDPRSLIMVTEMVAGNEIILPFLLNNDASEGPIDQTFSMELHTDGADHLFGDLGNDWIVGGTGRDHFFGGRGNDLLQMDDDLETGNHNENTKPDAYQEYADIAFDGAGRDYLILNTGADRAIAWIGEYNSFIVPFSPFGAFQIARLLQPHTEQFVLDLAESSGGDTSAPDILRFAEQVAIDDKLDNPLDPSIYDDRQGSPFNELGMVRQEDFDWNEQSGPPDDPQAGNEKGPRKIMRRELWLPEDTNGSIASALAKAEADEWYLVEQAFAEAYGADESTLELVGKLKLSSGVEVFGTLGDGETEFSVVDFSTKVTVDKFGKKDAANAYAIYDLSDDANFKFAGLDVSGKAVTIGYVENGNWIVVASVSTKLRAGSEYVLTVHLEGESVTVSIDGELLVSHSFTGLVVDGGYGLAATGTQAVFQNTSIVGTPSISIEGGSTSDETVTSATVASTTEVIAAEETLVVWDETVTVESTTTSTSTTETRTLDSVVSSDEEVTAEETTTEQSLLEGGDTVTGEATTSLSTSETDLQLLEESTSSDPVATSEEEVVVESWAPRDDFAA